VVTARHASAMSNRTGFLPLVHASCATLDVGRVTSTCQLCRLPKTAGMNVVRA